MTKIIPEGAPVWARTATIGQYGGSVLKRDYMDRGPIDQITDVGAKQFARMTADLTAAAYTSPFAILRVRFVPTGSPVVECAHMMTGVRLAEYSGEPPWGFPTVTRNGTSDITITFAESYADSYGVEAPLVLTHASASPLYDAVTRAVCQVVTPTSVRVRLYNASDSPITEPVAPATLLRASVLVQ
jgi:hypothetical protein